MSVRNYSEIGENGQIIIKALMKNQRLMRLLYYSDKDPLGSTHEDLSNKIIEEKIFGHFLKIVPVVGPKETANSVVVLKFEDFTPNYQNKEFKDVVFKIEVFVPLNNWIIKDTNLRPFLIMGEVEKSLKNKTINGLGRIVSNGAALNFLTDEISVYEMSFMITSYD